ncbi:MAG: TrkH family potassium uptake protein [Burkholderiaceae bacterium]
MHGRSILRLIGLLLLIYSISFVPSLIVAIVTADGEIPVFLGSISGTLALGCALWLPNRGQRAELSVRDGFLFVTLFWVILGLTGSLPFMLGLHLNLTDAVFESVSGFTTAGATVIGGLDVLPPSVLYHRQQIQWLGGMGVIVLAVAILPMLGVGGLQLYRAESSGVTKSDKLTPRIGETARAFWLIYSALTVACGLAYWAAGMNAFDALGHAFSTIATGGFSTHDASLAHYNSPLIEAIAILFMLAGGINFGIHYLALMRGRLRTYASDSEVRTYFAIFVLGSAVVAVSLWLTNTFASLPDAIRHATFEVASVLTSTGFTTDDFSLWPLHIPLVLVMLSFIGGCAGSTAGGIKVMRIMLLAKLGIRQLRQLAHPQSVSIIKLGSRAVREDVLYSVWGFYVLYVAVALLVTLLMMAAGLDLESAFGATLATLNLLGPGLGDVASSFAEVGPMVKWVGVFAMLVGRLEMFTLLILFLPEYWRH